MKDHYEPRRKFVIHRRRSEPAALDLSLHKTEELLRQSEERYRELFENANDIVYTHDLAGNFTPARTLGTFAATADPPPVATLVSAPDVKAFGGVARMTGASHRTGTDRVAEVARELSSDIIVNVQGDEPEIEPATIDSLIERLQTSTDDMATAATLFPVDDNPQNPNLVKVVISPQGHAIYFSRLPIPYFREPITPGSCAYYLHLGIYAYRRKFLLEYSAWSPTPLEKAEKLEQLRALEHGKSIYVVKVSRALHGIDTPDQYEAFVKRYLKQTKGHDTR